MMYAVLLSLNIKAQSAFDTTVHKRHLDSLTNVIFKLKDSNSMLVYINKILTRTKYIDTVYNLGDSLAIEYKSVDGQTVKRVKQKLNTTECVQFEITEYLNNIKLPEFSIFIEQTCLSGEESRNSNHFVKTFVRYTRDFYDNLNRLATKIFRDDMVGTRKIKYKYDLNGLQQIESVEKIDKLNFWD